MDREKQQEKIIRKMYDFAKRAVCDFAEIEAMTLPRNMSVDGKNYNLPQFKEIMQGLDSEISGLGENEVKLYANPDYPSTLMSYMRTSITKENAEDFTVFLSKGEINAGFPMLEELKRIVAFCTIAQIGDNTDLLLNSSPALTGDEMIELFIESKIPSISIFSVRVNDFEKYYVNISRKTENELIDAFGKLDKPFADMGIYGEQISAGDYANIRNGDNLYFALEFDMDKDMITLITANENSYDLPMPFDAKYKEGRTKADTDTMDIPDNLSELSEVFSKKKFKDIDAFAEYVKEHIGTHLDFYPERVSVDTTDIDYILEITAEKGKSSPLILLNSFYDDYLNGSIKISDVLDNIAATYEKEISSYKEENSVSFMDLGDYVAEYIKEHLGFEPVVSVLGDTHGIEIDINGRDFYFDEVAEADGFRKDINGSDFYSNTELEVEKMLEGIVETLESDLTADKKKYYIVNTSPYGDEVKCIGYFDSIDRAKDFVFDRMGILDLLVGFDKDTDISPYISADGYFLFGKVENNKEKLYLCESAENGLYFTADYDFDKMSDLGAFDGRYYDRDGKVLKEDLLSDTQKVKAKSR
jgi:hypothetical protein